MFLVFRAREHAVWNHKKWSRAKRRAYHKLKSIVIADIQNELRLGRDPGKEMTRRLEQPVRAGARKTRIWLMACWISQNDNACTVSVFYFGLDRELATSEFSMASLAFGNPLDGLRLRLTREGRVFVATPCENDDETEQIERCPDDTDDLMRAPGSTVMRSSTTAGTTAGTPAGRVCRSQKGDDAGPRENSSERRLREADGIAAVDTLDYRWLGTETQDLGIEAVNLLFDAVADFVSHRHDISRSKYAIGRPMSVAVSLAPTMNCCVSSFINYARHSQGDETTRFASMARAADNSQKRQSRRERKVPVACFGRSRAKAKASKSEKQCGAKLATAVDRRSLKPASNVCFARSWTLNFHRDEMQQASMA